MGILANVFARFVDTDKARVFGIRTDMLERLGLVLGRDRKAQLGVAIVGIVGFMAAFAPILAPHDPMGQDFPVLLEPQFVGAGALGTDSYGRDMLSRLIYGARISLLVGIGAVAVGAIIGMVIGLVAGFFGGLVDDVLMRMIDIFWAFPYLLVAIMLVAIFGQGLWNVIIALGFAYIDDFARIIRGEVLALREEEFTLAARSIGLTSREIMVGEIFPNTIAPLLVMYTVLVARAMIAEATLSFLGLGVRPSTPTWGSLLGQGRGFVTEAWWIGILPGLMIVITVFGINLFGDALRDAFDVRRSEGG